MLNAIRFIAGGSNNGTGYCYSMDFVYLPAEESCTWPDVIGSGNQRNDYHCKCEPSPRPDVNTQWSHG
ncbi:unnamed protein product [Dovyalis caffra]|uniref:Uncharacterized protein n=1 Tax=Dovyalis caffra TaxID=77055 RepID=A0AAV1QZE4_9ROSI|nr:unnamed protein product [Dovyalis caffra]